MDYWAETMQDDCYLIAADGWKAETTRIIETDKKGKEKDKGWTCDLDAQAAHRRPLLRQGAGRHRPAAGRAGSRDRQPHRAGGGTRRRGRRLGALDKVAKAKVSARLKEIKGDKDAKDEAAVLKRWLELSESEAALKRTVAIRTGTSSQLKHHNNMAAAAIGYRPTLAGFELNCSDDRRDRDDEPERGEQRDSAASAPFGAGVSRIVEVEGRLVGCRSGRSSDVEEARA